MLQEAWQDAVQAPGLELQMAAIKQRGSWVLTLSHGCHINVDGKCLLTIGFP